MGPEEKSKFRDVARRWAEFSGLSEVTHCIMDNHFHLMLWVPQPENVDDRELIRRMRKVWPEEKVECWAAMYRESPKGKREAMRKELTDRMANLPAFMRVVKQSFASWYNRRHGKRGTLWDGRYRSVVVEETPLALLSVAAYVDLNPIRAGLCGDPGEYAWCGYGDAVNGNPKSRGGLEFLVARSRGFLPGGTRSEERKGKDGDALEMDWTSAEATYRLWLLDRGISQKDHPWAKEKFRHRKGFAPLDVLKEFEHSGAVPLARALRKRLRSFTRGVAVGRPEFLQSLMMEHRSCFGEKRKQAARKMKSPWAGLHTLREVD